MLGNELSTEIMPNNHFIEIKKNQIKIVIRLSIL